VLLIAFAPNVSLFDAARAQKMLELHRLCAAFDANPPRLIPQREHFAHRWHASAYGGV
jgi:hypothetical protein